MVVNNKTEITSEEATKLLIKSSRNEYYKKYFFSIFLVAAGIPIMIIGFTSNNTIYISFGAIFIAFAIVLTIFNLISMHKIPKVVKEKNADICENGITYDMKFKEHSAIVIASSNGRHNKYEYSYDLLKKIYEYPDKYELKFQSNITLYVDKNGFNDKKMEEFFRKNVTTTKKKIKSRK